MNPIRLFGVFVVTFALGAVTNADIVEVGDLNIIDQVGNPSDGLRYLDMSFSDGLSKAAALANAQATYANARLATPLEFDDLFAAANISYIGSSTASDAFSTGIGLLISNSATGTYDGGKLRDALGYTQSTGSADFTIIWSDPDGSEFSSGTRDELELSGVGAVLGHHSDLPPDLSRGWLIVSAAAVPEPSSATLFLLASAWCVCGRRRKWERF